MLTRWMLVCCGWLLTATAVGESRTLDARLYHLRMQGPPEWSEFPAAPDADRLQISFQAEANSRPQSLRLRQQDVKQDWVVRLNKSEIGKLTRDENDLWVYLPVPAGVLDEGENTLTIEQVPSKAAAVDDIRVGEISLHSRPVDALLAETQLEIVVVDRAGGQPVPSRITIVDPAGTLQPVQVPSDPSVAVREGTVYTANGRAQVGLPAGRYTLFAGRGFEYSLASEQIQVKPGDSLRVQLAIEREVPTEGYIACDTHIHSRTHSGHGDATVAERMVTIAAEGIELAVATDHNIAVDHQSVAAEVGVRQYFTPVVGNEVTTPVGHFNIFPVDPQSPPSNHRLRDWTEIFEEIERTSAAPVVILNHGRDLHSGFRPLGPRNFNAAVAANVHGWPLRFNAMEVVNSGATQTDVMQLFRDWMSLLNRGVSVTPVGSSDSHDVLRHFVGQGRTYIRGEDHDPAAIDVAEAVRSFREGHVMVSYGLLTEMHVQGAGAGELAMLPDDTLQVEVRVLGPHWVTADRVEWFMNGRLVHEELISTNESPLPRGVKWQGQLTLPKPAHDVHLVAIARGPRIDQPYWRTAKPYQPTSPAGELQTIGCSGAVWIDADGDGKRSSARAYAVRLWDASEGSLTRLLEMLQEYDQAVASHAAELFQSAGNSLLDDSVQDQLRRAAPATQAGFRDYLEAWRENQLAATQDP